MRENRSYGSEGGGAGYTTGPPYPYLGCGHEADFDNVVFKSSRTRRFACTTSSTEIWHMCSQAWCGSHTSDSPSGQGACRIVFRPPSGSHFFGL